MMDRVRFEDRYRSETENNLPVKKRITSFKDGYVDGHQAILGKELLPAIPSSFVVPPRQTPYEHGYERGSADAKKLMARKPSN